MQAETIEQFEQGFRRQEPARHRQQHAGDALLRGLEEVPFRREQHLALLQFTQEATDVGGKVAAAGEFFRDDRQTLFAAAPDCIERDLVENDHRAFAWLNANAGQIERPCGA